MIRLEPGDGLEALSLGILADVVHPVAEVALIELQIVQRILRSKSHAFQLSRALTELPKPQRDEYETDFWRKFSVRHSIAQYFPTPHGWLLTHINRSSGADFTSAEQVMLA